MRVFKVKVNGKSYDVEVDEVGGASAQVAAPIIQSATVTASAAAPATQVSAGTQLKSPLPGLILGFKVENGASVKKGQVVLELEAMKMANDIAASCDGKITFSVAKGATVNTGDILAIIS